MYSVIRFLKLIITSAYCLVIYSFIFLPVAVLVLFSFQGGRFPILPFNGPSTKWYEQVLADSRLTESMLNSLVVATSSSTLAVLLGFMAAYGLARFSLPATQLQRTLLTAPLTVSYLVIGFGLLILFNSLGVSLSLWTIGIGHVVINTPLCFAIIYSQMGDHQVQAEMAARDLGANELKTLWFITVPMLMPAIMASFFLSVTFSWDEFIIAFLLSRFDVTLPVEIWSMLRSGLNPKTNAAGSLVFLVSIVVVVLTEFLVFRRFNRGR